MNRDISFKKGYILYKGMKILLIKKNIFHLIKILLMIKINHIPSKAIDLVRKQYTRSNTI